jgi:hypothetical protein
MEPLDYGARSGADCQPSERRRSAETIKRTRRLGKVGGPRRPVKAQGNETFRSLCSSTGHRTQGVPMLDHAELLRRLHYSPSTGKWTRLVSAGRVKAGSSGSTIRKSRHIVSVLGKRYFSTRLAWFYMTGRWPSGLIDHKNRNTLDDRWRNLRECTTQQNSWNAKRKTPNISGLKGVYWNGRRWLARIKVAEKYLSLGTSKNNKRELKRLYDQAAEKYRGEFARA